MKNKGKRNEQMRFFFLIEMWNGSHALSPIRLGVSSAMLRTVEVSLGRVLAWV